MPGTPSPLKLSFNQNNQYTHVPASKRRQNAHQQSDQNTELLKDTKYDHGPPPLQPGVTYINTGEDDQMEVHGYRRQPLLTVITWLCIILTAGILRLIFHWWPHWMLYATHKKCCLNEAEKVLIVETYQRKYKCHYVKPVLTVSSDNIRDAEYSDTKEAIVSDQWDDHVLTDIKFGSDMKLSIHLSGGIFREVLTLRMFRCKKLSYIWDEEKGEFLKLVGLDKDVSTAVLHQQEGLSVHQQNLRRVVYGRNEIVVPVKTVITLLFLEVLNPFYVFQLFSFCLWFADNYVYYALAILAMSAFGIIMAIIQTRKNQRNLRSTVHSSDVATVIRGETRKLDIIPTEHLVPGDILVVPSHGCIMHCDAVLLTGNCIVNESMLTGESVPVTKTPLPNTLDSQFDTKEHARHILFCGTHVIQTRYFGNERVLAVVIRTGFSTAKGELVRSIMYPPPVDFKFEHDSYKFVEFLAGIASIGFIYTVVTKYIRGVSVSEIALEALDLITIVVPPALPAAMTVGRFYAQNRLRAKNIFCISPRTINVSGSIDCVCFDKTGTLTEDGLDMWGVVPVSDSKFQVPVKNVDKMDYTEQFLVGMVACHSITIIDGKLCGDPLDLKMFESTAWQLEEPEVNDNSKFDMIFPTVVKPPQTEYTIHSSPDDDLEPPLEIGIVRQFPFSSNLQRMSVIIRTLGASHFQVYCKGSPEMILALSQPETVPSDFSSVLEEYTQEGYRVLALAYRDLPKVSYAKVQRLSREDVESNLIFLGLIVMENRLKPETTGIISMLRDANIRTIMVTGDNMLTALSVARDCGIIPLGQRVIVPHGIAGHVGQQAQIVYTNSNNNIHPPNMTCGSVTNSNSFTSFDTMESGTLSPSISMAIDDVTTTAESNYCFAMTGKTWMIAKTHFPDVVTKLATRGAVFARMSPDQKQQLVQELQALGYYVAMCGDGANDCGALKAAHAGISLSEAESSVASPFTSREGNISCVPQVIREGRAALVTSFGIFKYMAAYSLTQFVTVMILYYIDSNLTDIEFLYIDLFVITVFAFFFGRTEAYEGPLVRQPPILSLISLPPILSLLLQLAIVIAFQILSFWWVQQMPWFVPFNSTIEASDPACYENYALFSVSSLQYIILALVFSKGAPYRKSVFSNYGFLFSLIFLTAFTLYLIIEPAEWLISAFQLKLPPYMDFRLMTILMVFVNFVLAAFTEYFIVDYLVFHKLCCKIGNAESKNKKYLIVERLLRSSPSWPPINHEAIVETEPPTCVRPPNSPAALNVSAIRLEFNSPQLGTGDSVKQAPQLQNGSILMREITLNPSALPAAKRRHHSENESGAPWQVVSSPVLNGLATFPRRGLPHHSLPKLNLLKTPQNLNCSAPDVG